MTHGDVTKHIKRKHLKYIAEVQKGPSSLQLTGVFAASFTLHLSRLCLFRDLQCFTSDPSMCFTPAIDARSSLSIQVWALRGNSHFSVVHRACLHIGCNPLNCLCAFGADGSITKSLQVLSHFFIFFVIALIVLNMERATRVVEPVVNRLVEALSSSRMRVRGVIPPSTFSCPLPTLAENVERRLSWWLTIRTVFGFSRLNPAQKGSDGRMARACNLTLLNASVSTSR
jgi:hypothetical protein